MARKSERLSSSAKATPTHKRAASSTIAAPSAQGKRSKKATPTKSQYFQAEDDQDAPDDNGPNEESTAEDEDASDFGDEDEDPPSSDGEDDDEGDGSDDDEPKSRKKSTARKGGATSHVIRTKGKELWRPGVKAGLGPGTQVVIKKPKARPAGKVPYSDETIHPNTLSFLEDLKANNDRQWLKSKSHSRFFGLTSNGSTARIGEVVMAGVEHVKSKKTILLLQKHAGYLEPSTAETRGSHSATREA